MIRDLSTEPIQLIDLSYEEIEESNNRYKSWANKHIQEMKSFLEANQVTADYEIKLGGSREYGFAHEESDIDIHVIIPDMSRSESIRSVVAKFYLDEFKLAKYKVILNKKNDLLLLTAFGFRNLELPVKVIDIVFIDVAYYKTITDFIQERVKDKFRSQTDIVVYVNKMRRLYNKHNLTEYMKEKEWRMI
jgi:hypothetical protein